MLVHATGWLLLISGVAWLCVHYGIGAGAGELPHPRESWLLRLHALAAWVGAFTLGEFGRPPCAARLAPAPAPRRRAPRQRRLGVALCALGGALVASGYALMYFVGEPARPAWDWAHAGIGAAMAGALVWHARGARHPW